MNSYDGLIAAIPARLSQSRSHRSSEKTIREAVIGLTLANPERAMREIEQLLDGMQAAIWSGGERIAALEYLRTPVAAMCGGVERQVGTESHPLPPSSSERAATAQRLQEKMASGYAIGLHELCAPAGRLPRFKTKLAAMAAVRGLTHADRALLWACRRYQAPPVGLWQRVHALYGFAGELGIADRVVEDPDVDGVPGNVRDAYAHLLLFAISNPYRFSAREMDEAWRVCGCVACLCVLARAGGEGIGVDTNADAGPGYIPEERLTADSGVVSIDVSPVRATLDGRMALLPEGVDVLDLPRPGGDRVATSAGFLRRLCLGWGNAPRGHKRLAAVHALDAVIGMHALHYALAGNVDFAGFVRKVHGDAITVGQDDLPSAWMAASDTAHPRVFRGEVLDQSEGGYRMRLAIVEGLRLRIGDVMGLAPVVEGIDARDWMVGVIRWLRHEKTGVLLGIELLQRAARAAGVRITTTDGEALAPQRAVELHDGGGENVMSLLVTHPLTGNAVTAEVVLPKLASDWRSQAAVGSWHPNEVEALGPACFRVTLVRDEDRISD